MQLLYLVSTDLLKETKEYLEIYNKLFLTNAGFFLSYIVIVSYILVKLKIQEEKKDKDKQPNSKAKK